MFSVIVTNTVFISINNIHVIKDIRNTVVSAVTTAPVSPPVAASLHVARAARGEAERVYDHVSLVGADSHQLVVHVLLPARGHVSATSSSVPCFWTLVWNSITWWGRRGSRALPPGGRRWPSPAGSAPSCSRAGWWCTSSLLEQKITDWLTIHNQKNKAEFCPAKDLIIMSTALPIFGVFLG